MSLNILIAPSGFKESLLIKATEEVMRMIRVGALLAPRQTQCGAKMLGHRAKSTCSPLRLPAKSRIRARARVGLSVANPC